jgi:hypothetical protein
MELGQPMHVFHPHSKRMHALLCGVLAPKNMFASIKKLPKICVITFLFKKTEEEFDKLFFSKSEFAEHEIQCYH